MALTDCLAGGRVVTKESVHRGDLRCDAPALAAQAPVRQSLLRPFRGLVRVFVCGRTDRCREDAVVTVGAEDASGGRIAASRFARSAGLSVRR